MLRASRASAAATLAQIMNSSISRWLSSRLRGVIATDAATLIQLDLPLRQIQFQRAAPGAGGVQDLVGLVQRRYDRIEQGAGRVVLASSRASWTCS